MLLSSVAIKQRMEKDVDEVGKISRFIKAKIEELDKEVRLLTTFILAICCPQSAHFIILMLDRIQPTGRSLDVEKEQVQTGQGQQQLCNLPLFFFSYPFLVYDLSCYDYQYCGLKHAQQNSVYFIFLVVKSLQFDKI